MLNWIWALAGSDWAACRNFASAAGRSPRASADFPSSLSAFASWAKALRIQRKATAVSLEISPQSQLNIARVAGSGRAAEAGGPKRISISVPLRMVKDTIELRAELQTGTFALEHAIEILAQRRLGIVEARLAGGVTGGIAELAHGRPRERVGVEPGQPPSRRRSRER